MMGARTVMQEALFYSFSLEDHVPQSHLLRAVDRFVDLSGIREKLRPFYSETGRPSIDPELMIRMLLIGYCLGIRSERRLCEEVHLNLAYRWFCRLGLDGAVPDHSTFSKNRHGRFRDSDLLRDVFEMTVTRCIEEGLVGGEGFAVDASLIKADANRQRGVPGEDGLPPNIVNHAAREYLEVLDEAAFGAASPATPKYLSPADPAARWTSAHGGQAFFAYSTNYLIDLANAVIVDVEATTAIRPAEVTAQRTMIDRTQERFGICPSVWPPILVMAMQPISPGLSMSAASNRTSLFSITRGAGPEVSNAMNSATITKMISMYVPAAKSCSRAAGTSRRCGATSIKTGLSATAPANMTAMPALSSRNAAPDSPTA